MSALSVVLLGIASACSSGDRTGEAASGPTTGSAPTSASSGGGSPSPSPAPVADGPMLTIPQATLTLPTDGPDADGWQFTRSSRLQLASAAFTLPDDDIASVSVTLDTANIGGPLTLADFAERDDESVGGIALRRLDDRTVDGRLMYVKTGADGDERVTEAGRVVDEAAGGIVGVSLTTRRLPAARHDALVAELLGSLTWSE